ncbi:MAG: lipase [Alphaproteobacteria bacterium]|nr:lipase [Alphaproteobacteria bacterium]
MKETVILLHGILKTSRHMRPLADFLIKQGYSVQNIDYPSTKYDLEELTEMIWHKVKWLQKDKVHLIGYSMGGLLIRVLLKKHKLKNLGKVVQIGTPNHGSEVADFLKKSWLYRKIFGQAGQQLVTNQKSFEHLIGQSVEGEWGIIAGSFSLDPISSIFLKGLNDGKVSVQNTKIKGMSDHCFVSASHLFLPKNHDVHQKVLSFLKTGIF